MRTTVSIDDALLAEVKLLAAQHDRTLGSVFEEALRRLLAERSVAPSRTPYVLPDFHYDGGLRPGLDLYDKELLATAAGEETGINAAL